MVCNPHLNSNLWPNVAKAHFLSVFQFSQMLSGEICGGDLASGNFVLNCSWFVLIYVQIVLYLYKSSLAILYFHLYFVLLKSPCPSVGVPQFLPHLKHMHTYLMLTGGPFTSGVFIFVLQPFCTSFFSFSLHILFSLQVLCSFTIHCPLFITQMTNVHILPATYNFPNFSFFSFQSNYFFNDNFSFFVLTLICTNIN